MSSSAVAASPSQVKYPFDLDPLPETSSPLLELTLQKVEATVGYLLKTGRNIKNVFSSQSNHLVCSVTQYPQLIFKMRRAAQAINPTDFPMSLRFENIQKGRAIIEADRLGLLLIPRADLFSVTVGDRLISVLVEERLEVEEVRLDDSSTMEPDHRVEAIRQLATFIFRTGFCDINIRNVPLYKTSKGYKFVLLDLENMSSVRRGLYGDSKWDGLANLFRGNAVDLIETEIDKLLVTKPSDFSDVVNLLSSTY